MIYRKHGVENIKDARAEMSNLTLTTDVILKAVSDAKQNSTYIIVFVTGIPGAGKTLCGLNVAFSANDAAFLTGTLPMVYVLTEALAIDADASGKKSKRITNHNTKSKIQSITGFLRDNIPRLEAPAEHVIVFDEAQRAWDANYGAKSKFKLPNSEAAIVLDIMHRHKNYAVIVALVGNGQEINSGEAGLAEWGKALAERSEWQVRAAPGVIAAEEPRQRLFQTAPASMMVDPALHLCVPIRSIRSTAGAVWVDAVLRGRVSEAAEHAKDGIPFFVTRSLADMRSALRSSAGGLRRAGLVCSSGAKRLVADGLWPKFDHLDDKNVANWFLKRWPEDIRASDALEIPATQFACQGLELDYVGLCWGGDFTWNNGWVTRNFKGTKWQYAKRQDDIDFSRNTYRVLLTRARYDTIIWIPEGDVNDRTRDPTLFNNTAEFLLECGAILLEKIMETSIPAVPEPSLL